MKIGIDASRITVLQRTGTENYSLCLTRALAKVDTSNRYVLYFRGRAVSFDNPRFSTQVIPWPFLWTQGGLAWECLMHPPDLVFIPAHTLPVLRRPSLKSVVTIHDLGVRYLPQYHQFPQRLYLDKAVRYAARHATHLIAVSEATKKDIIARFGVSEKKITVVYEGVEQTKFKIQNPKSKIGEVRRKYNIRGEYVLFVGTVQPRKNLRRLIEAFSKVGGEDTQLVIAGKPGWSFEDIYSAPSDFGVARRVQFLGHVSDQDLPALYWGSRCLAFPSLFEGFGLPVLESMASGVPVVTSNVSSLPEVGGNAAVYVDPYKVASIASGLHEVLTGSMRFRQNLISKGFLQVEKFSWEKAARETLAVFEKVGGVDERSSS